MRPGAPLLQHSVLLCDIGSSSLSPLLPSASEAIVGLRLLWAFQLEFGPNLLLYLNAAGHPLAQDDTFPQTLGGPTTVLTPGILGNDSIPCGTDAVVKVVSPPQFGSVSISRNGGLVYSPGLKQISDSFVYEVNCNGQVGGLCE